MLSLADRSTTRSELLAMLLDLREVRGSEDRVDRSYPASAFTTHPADEYTVADAVALALRVRKDGNKYRVVGQVRGRLRFSCCRCLEPFEVQSDIAVDLLYLPQSTNQGEGESEVSYDDLSTAFYRDEQIDLGQMVREQLELALPMKPLCRGDCLGLCPVCGTNLNRERCTCDTRWSDPRLAVLESLRPDRQR